MWLLDETPSASSERDDNVVWCDADFLFMVNVSRGPNRDFRLTRTGRFFEGAGIAGGPSGGEAYTAETTQSAHLAQTHISPDY